MNILIKTTVITTAFLALIVLPTDAFADSLSLQDRAAMRRAERLQNRQTPQATSLIRLPNTNIRTTASLRRRNTALSRMQQRLQKRLLERGITNDDTATNSRASRVAPRITQRSVRTLRRTERSSVIQPSSSNQRLAKMLTMINAERRSNNAAPLMQSIYLQRSAQGHAEDMVQRSFFSGETPDGKDAEYRIKRAGYAKVNEKNCNCESWSYKVSEVFAKGSQNPETIFTNWLNNPRAFGQLLSDDYSEIGIGNAEDVWVVDLGHVSIVEVTPFSQQQQSTFADEVLRLTNIEREKEGLSTLRRNTSLDESALRHAQDMYERDFFAHDTPEGLTIRDRVEQTDYLEDTNGFGLGENIAKGQDTPEEVMDGWMNSPGHRANILKPDFDELGIGLYGDVWVQNFGVRLP